MARRALGLFLLVLTTLVVGCDHATKLAAVHELRPRGTVDVVPGVLDLRYTQNDDTAFSLLHRIGAPMHDAAFFLAAVAAIVLVAVSVLWWRRRHDPSPALHVGFAMIVAGALGNLVDRVLRGFVVDFIHVHLWPVFNVADVAVVAGTILLAMVAQTRASSRDARV